MNTHSASNTIAHENDAAKRESSGQCVPDAVAEAFQGNVVGTSVVRRCIHDNGIFARRKRGFGHRCQIYGALEMKVVRTRSPSRPGVGDDNTSR